MFTDETRCNIWNQLRQLESLPFAKLLTPTVFQAAAQSAGVRVGKSALNAANLAWLAVMGALHSSRNFADLLVLTLKLLEDAANPDETIQRLLPPKRRGKRSKRDPRGESAAVSEEAFVQARKKLPVALWMCLLGVLAERFQQQHREYVYWKNFRLLMLDGSDIALQRRQSLLDHYGAAGCGQARTPQARMLMLAFAQSRLPWRYEIVPQSCHEQTAAKRLLQGLAANDLVLMDRGFWNYGLFWQVQQQGAYFGIRLRAGVKMKSIKRLGDNDALMEWTPKLRSKKRCTWAGSGLPRSIRLRVVRYQIAGFRPSAVVTNVLSPCDISREEWVRMAVSDQRGQVLEAGLYHRRWEIETLFHELKVMQGMEGGLRSRTPQGVEYEIGGHILLYLLVRWLMVEAATEHGKQPLQLSFKNALRELDHMRDLLIISPRDHVRKVLLPRLMKRIAIHVIDVRPGRHYPRPTDKYTLGKYRKRSQNNQKKT